MKGILNMKKISVVIPMYYEEEVANECYKKMTEVLSKIDGYDYELTLYKTLLRACGEKMKER